MSVTIKDIAKKVGLSVTTVSRALNDYDDVNIETKALIRQTAKDMGYIPNSLAQRFQKKKTDTIGLILPTFGPRFSDPFFSELLAGIGNKAATHGYDLLVSTRPPGEDELLAYRQMVQGHRVDGLVVVRTRQQDERIDYLCNVDFPFVSFGRTEDDLDFPYVDEDGAHGMRLVAEHLFRLGHRKIACIASPPELMFSQYRMDGLCSRLAELGSPLPDSLIRRGDMSQRSGYEQANTLLDLTDRPTAIVVCNDLMAFGAMSAIQDRGLTVGKEISIIGFDNTPMSAHTHPPLTTVHQPIYQIGNMVCEMLIQCVQGQQPEERQVLMKPELILRQSSGPVPVS
ncbi:MAG: LacI family DNA-binding transcriptional regulator [Anaerolineaceae bacterium]|nr:LacI family DNA-binding transcriptional regulator [Anaerolineaceae bacterium]